MTRRPRPWNDIEIQNLVPRILCCRMAPRCEFHHCERPADCSAMVPFTWKPPLRVSPKFFCIQCWNDFALAWKTPLKGIDRPEHADEDWKPSILEHLRHAEIAIAFEERDRRSR